MSQTNKIHVGVVGATGLVGEIFLKLLSERRLPVGELKLFASDRSRGQTRNWNDRTLTVDAPSKGAFKGLDVVFFSSGDDVSREWAPIAVEEGAVAIDNSAAFRMHAEHVLGVPEVNGHLLPRRGTPALIANPNCSTIQLVLALNPLHKDFGLESVHVATYQAVSGAGKAGQEDLKSELEAWSAGRTPPSPQTFPHSIAMNAIPQVGSFNAEGFCSEEMKIMKETHKILGDSSFRVSAFTVRVPVWNTHSEAVWVRLKKNVDRQAVLSSLSRQKGLKIVAEGYDTAIHLSGKDETSVGRIHRDLSDPQTWLMWVVSDNLRKGAALNGIQIAERIFDLNT